MTSTATPKPKLSFSVAPVTFALQRFPFVRRAVWRTFYNTIHRQVSADDFVFMNLGYANDEDDALTAPLPIAHFSQRLYDRVIGGVAIAGKDVLEVGCGRGGGAAHVHGQYRPRSLIGVDLSAGGIAACNALHARAELSFQIGDATQLPFADGSFDALINVESSHCYPSRARFFAEVERVLRPAGHFLYADVFWPHLDDVGVADVERMLSDSGLAMLGTEDISQNVARARSRLGADPEFERTLDRWSKKAASKTAAKVRREAYALPGSFHYQALVDGAACYRRWVMQKASI